MNDILKNGLTLFPFSKREKLIERCLTFDVKIMILLLGLCYSGWPLHECLEISMTSIWHMYSIIAHLSLGDTDPDSDLKSIEGFLH